VLILSEAILQVSTIQSGNKQAYVKFVEVNNY